MSPDTRISGTRSIEAGLDSLFEVARDPNLQPYPFHSLNTTSMDRQADVEVSPSCDIVLAPLGKH